VLKDSTKCPKCEARRNEGDFCTNCGFKYQSAPHSVDERITKPRSTLVPSITIILIVVIGIWLLVLLAN